MMIEDVMVLTNRRFLYDGDTATGLFVVCCTEYGIYNIISDGYIPCFSCMPSAPSCSKAGRKSACVFFFSVWLHVASLLLDFWRVQFWTPSRLSCILYPHISKIEMIRYHLERAKPTKAQAWPRPREHSS